MKESKALEIRNILVIKEFKNRVIRHLNVITMRHRNYMGVLNVSDIYRYFNSHEFNHKNKSYTLEFSVFNKTFSVWESYIHVKINMYGKVIAFDYHCSASLFIEG